MKYKKTVVKVVSIIIVLAIIVEDTIAEGIIDGVVKDNSKVNLTAENEKVVIK